MISLKKETIEKKGKFIKTGRLNRKSYFGMFQPCICDLYQDSNTLYLYFKESEFQFYDAEFQITRKTDIDFLNEPNEPFFTLTNPEEINETLQAFDFLKLIPKKGELILSGKDNDTVASWVLTIRMRLFCKVNSDSENDNSKENLQIKKVNADSFEVLSVLGRGYFGKVTLVRHKENDKLYAMKTIKKSHIFKKRKVNNVLTERNILIQVDHPFIVNFYYAFQTSKKFYLIMEYIPGGELFTHIRNNVFNEKDTILYLAEIALALDYLHSIGIIYRDLKPENVLFNAEGHIKLTDFGLSKQISLQEFNSQTTTFCGTFEYMAPEMITINNPEIVDQDESDSSSSSLSSYSFEIDWWSFGILAYEMLFGKTPFYNKNQMKMLKSIVEREVSFPKNATLVQKDFISKFLQKDPSVRADFKNMKSHPFWDNLDFNEVLEGNVRSSCNPSLLSKNTVNNFDTESITESIGSSISFRKRMIPGFSYIYDGPTQENIISMES